MPRRSLGDIDHPLNLFFSRLFDILLIGLITIVCCLPVVTIGAAVTANYDVMIRMALKKDNHIIRRYFTAFGKNFLKSTAMGLVCLVMIAAMIVAWYMVMGGVVNISQAFRTVIMIATIILSVLVAFVVIYVFPLQARFENGLLKTFRNALFISIAQVPRSLTMVAVTAGLAIIGIVWIGLLPVVLLVYFSVATYFFARSFVKIFALYGDREAAGEEVSIEEAETEDKAGTENETETEDKVENVDETGTATEAKTEDKAETEESNS